MNKKIDHKIKSRLFLWTVVGVAIIAGAVIVSQVNKTKDEEDNLSPALTVSKQRAKSTAPTIQNKIKAPAK